MLNDFLPLGLQRIGLVNVIDKNCARTTDDIQAFNLPNCASNFNMI